MRTMFSILCFGFQMDWEPVQEGMAMYGMASNLKKLPAKHGRPLDWRAPKLLEVRAASDVWKSRAD